MVLLKHTVFFFLKSKQRSLCGKMHLGPGKNSISLRQELRCAKKRSGSAAKKAKIKGQNLGQSEEQDPLPDNIESSLKSIDKQDAEQRLKTSDKKIK